jgi:hypothetical protein
MQTWQPTRGLVVAALAAVLLSGAAAARPAPSARAAQASLAVGAISREPQQQSHATMTPLAVPTAVIPRLAEQAAHPYLDCQGRYQSTLAPYSVCSHWRAGEVGGAGGVARNDRFTKVCERRYIDLLALPNSQHEDTAQANRLLWTYLVQTGLQPHRLGRVRVLGDWVPLIGLTNLDNGQPYARLVFATVHQVWLLDLATEAQAETSDVHELAYVAGTFRLEH